MTLPSPESVQDLFTKTFPIPLVEAMIEDAASMMEDCKGYTEEKKARIIKYLAAHLIASAFPESGVNSKSIDGVTYSYRTPPLGEGMKSTSYGQIALAMDVNDCIPDPARRPVKLRLL